MSHNLIVGEEIAFGNIIIRNWFQDLFFTAINLMEICSNAS